MSPLHGSVHYAGYWGPPTSTLDWCERNYEVYLDFSMTTLLTHTVAHSTEPSFGPKTNKQPQQKSSKIGRHFRE